MALETLLEPSSQPSQPKPGLVERFASSCAASPSPSSGERRRHVRIKVAGMGAATVNIDERNAALLVNLCEGGMCVRALGRPVEPGATVRLRFQLPGSPIPIQTSGVVAWVNEAAEAGLRFTDVSEALAGRLRQWIAKNEISNAAREFLRAAGGWPAALELMAKLARMLTGASGVVIRLAAGKEPLIFSSVKENLPMRATVAAPLYAGDQIIGHLEISSPELGAFDEQDLGALPVLATLVGEMLDIRAAELRKATRRASQLSAKIVNKIEAIFPRAIRLYLVC